MLSEDLAPVFRAWYERKNRAFCEQWGKVPGQGPVIDNRTNDAYVQPFSPLALLAFETKVDSRVFYSIVNQERGYTDFDTADKLLNYMDESIHDFDTYPYREVAAATMMQTELIRVVAKTRGHFIPLETRKSKGLFPRLRKQYLKAA